MSEALVNAGTGQVAGQAAGTEQAKEERSVVFDPVLKRNVSLTREELAELAGKGFAVDSMQRDYTQKNQARAADIRERSKEQTQDIIRSYAEENPNLTMREVARDLGIELTGTAAASNVAGADDDDPMARIQKLEQLIADVRREHKEEVANLKGNLRMRDLGTAHPVFQQRDETGKMALATLTGIIGNKQMFQEDFGNDVERAAAAVAKQYAPKGNTAADIARHAEQAAGLPPTGGAAAAALPKAKDMTRQERLLHIMSGGRLDFS